jgi:hypothetical protein
VRSVFAISLLYVALYLFGAAVALGFGYELGPALFESISASAAVGLSVGIVSPDMPLLLEVTYIAQMWVGRLEFIAIAALIGFTASTVFGNESIRARRLVHSCSRPPPRRVRRSWRCRRCSPSQTGTTSRS